MFQRSSHPCPSHSEEDYVKATQRPDAPLYHKKVSPHRSLSNFGFASTIVSTACAFLLPLLAFLGTFALWALLPFIAAAVAALWYFIRRSDKDGTLSEQIFIWPDLIAVHRHNPRKRDQFWCANPFWVTVQTRHTKECPNYLTLKGAGREIELGAFLSIEERDTLHTEIRQNIAKTFSTATP